MKRINKKLITMLLSIVLLVSIASVTALAVTTVASGALDNGIKWSISSDGVLTISGEGEVPFYVYPWSEYAEDITSVIVEDGITELGGFNFWKLSFVESVSLPDMNGDGVITNVDVVSVARIIVGLE